MAQKGLDDWSTEDAENAAAPSFDAMREAARQADKPTATSRIRAIARQARPQERGGAPETSANRTMLRQFYGNLQVLFDVCGSPRNEMEARIHDRLHNILNPPDRAAQVAVLLGGRRSGRTWQKAYTAQQLVAAILPEPYARAELIKNYAEICEKQPGKKIVYETHMSDLKAQWDNDLARAILIRMLNDNQWYNSQKYQIRHMTTKYYIRLIYIFVSIALLFFMTLAFLPAFLVWIQSATTDSPRWGFAGFMYMLVAGFVGSSFSMLTSQRQAVRVRSIEAMAVLSGLPMILLRLMVGAGAAAILYFFFEAGLIGGAVFPKLGAIGFSSMNGETPASNYWSMVPNKDLSLLMIWGVLAGFSEKLVSTMLARVDKSMESETNRTSEP